METTTKSTVTVFARANSQLQNTIFQHSHSAFLQMTNKSLHAMLIKICVAIWNMARLSGHCHHCWNTLPSHCAHIHYMYIYNIYIQHSASVDEYQWAQFFSTQRNSVTHLCFIHTSVSDIILSNCPFAAIITQEHSLMEYWQKGSYHQHPPLTSWANIMK